VNGGVEILVMGGASLGATQGVEIGATQGVEIGATQGVEIGASLVGVEIDVGEATKTTATPGVEKPSHFFSKKRRFVSVPSTENVKNVVIKMYSIRIKYTCYNI